MHLLITSPQNPKVKEVVKLRDRRARDETSLFLIEGYRELKRALDAKREMRSLFYCPEFFLGENEKSLIEQVKKETVFRCTKEVFQKISYRDRPDGLLAIAPQVHAGLETILLQKNPFLLIAESIEKPGNLGTILRSCDAAGVDAVIVCDPTTDIHNPNVIRSSVGTLFTQKVVEASKEKTIEFLQTHQILSVAATPHAKQLFTDVNFQVPLAIVVGTEQYGLSETWMQEASLQVKIPMFGVADSLNVASATTLLLYEVIRQRNSIL